ncbi:MAG: hypothetical protein ACR2NU_06700, partial [Aeoliella sp.]
VTLNVCKYFTAATLGSRSALILVAVLATAGCIGDSYTPPSTESLLAIENIDKWFQLYRAENRGKPPADEDAFLAFINGTLTARGQAVVNRDEVLTSPRDGAPYAVRYGMAGSPDLERSLVAYEQNGANGTKLIVTELALSREVDDAELESLIAGD